MRDNIGRLRFNVVHPELIFDPNQSGKTLQQIVCDRLDASMHRGAFRYSEDHQLPIQYSLETYGLPDVMVRTCSHPDKYMEYPAAYPLRCERTGDGPFWTGQL